MVDIVYPSSLRVPQTSGVTPAERRALSQAERPRDARPRERDRRKFERVTFRPMTPEEAQIFRDWWRDDLVLGGAWFEANWPLPEGYIAAVRKFVGAPRWEYIPGGMWRVSAFTEVRGRSLTPTQPLPPPVAVAWDPATILGDTVLSDGNLVASNAGVGSVLGNGVRSNTFRTSGKWYFEVETVIGSAEQGNFRPAIGAARSNFNPGADYPEPRDHCYVYSRNIQGFDYVGTTAGTSGTYTFSGGIATYTSGDRIMIAMDLDNMRFWSGKNGVWNLSGNPETGANPRGTDQPAGAWGPFYWHQGGNVVPSSVRLIAITAGFEFAVPVGYSPFGEPP